MKLFQQLLVAPAALGLLAPIAANAAEVNINGVSQYASYEETYEADVEVSAAQFSDVIPGDWAYTALQNLSESYGCVDNAYSQNLKSGQSLTRYEAASLVNACLEGGIASADVNSDIQRLSNEFGTEMAILKGRIDGLEYKVKELSAGQFSSATKMSGQAVFQLGSIDVDTQTTAVTLGNPGQVEDGKLYSTYNYGLDLNTSFNGTDLLTVGIEASNQTNVYGAMDSATGASVANVLDVTSLFYSFPLGDSFTVTAGPLFDQDDVISATTSRYSDSFRLSSMPWGTAGNTGAGAAVEYANDSGFNASVSSVSVNGASATQGIWTNDGQDVITASVGYDGDRFGGGLIYTNTDNNNGQLYATRPFTGTADTSFGGGVYFQPDNFPTISVSYDTLSDNDAADMSDFMIGLDHPIGPGVASVAYQSRDQGALSTPASRTTSNYEFYYNYPVTDGIDVQAGIFVEGDLTTNRDNTIGYMVETYFKF